MKNGNLKWFFGIMSGVMVIIIAGWLMTTSAKLEANCTDVAVLKAQFTQLKADIQEVKADSKEMKSLVIDIRRDQLRREREERKR